MIGERIDRLRQFLREHVADGVIIMQPENLRYFSGFTGGEGALVVTGATAVLWTDSRYTEQAAGQSGTWYTIGNHQGRLAECIARSLREGGAQAVVYESNFLTHMMFEQIADQTECGFEGYNLNVLRAVKEPFELTATRKAS
ncbi:MAG TPA: aminopeptidase P family protein, partial [Megasphaera sp.]|nr:aminopeptidase P family protein [Megasphaera sp.]